MAYSANNRYISDAIAKNRAAWLANNPIVYSTDVPGVDINDQMAGNETFIYNG